MKITVLDGHYENPGDLSYEPLEKLGELTVYHDSVHSEDEAIRRIGDADVVVTSGADISERVLEACPSVKYITLFSTGYDNIDCAAAGARGIPVANIPSYGTAIVAQYAISLLLEICGHVQYHSDRVHRGDWSAGSDWYYRDRPVIELDGKTLGIIGLGRIGQRVAKIAGALGMRVIAFNRSHSAEGAGVAEYVSLDELFAQSDVISLHCPLFPETAKIIDRESIKKMKDGVILINNSRGGLVDEQALADALESGKVYAAGVDVVSSEPIKEGNPLYHAKNCFITPHLSWTAREARQRIMLIAADNIRSFLEGHPINVVN